VTDRTERATSAVHPVPATGPRPEAGSRVKRGTPAEIGADCARGEHSDGTDATKDHKRVSPEGKRIGALMARIAEREVGSLALQGEPDERCASCAFRVGTVPNGCIQTQSDVIKAVAEDVPFLCHAHRKQVICWGWFAARRVVDRMERARGEKLPPAPWEFSPPDEQR
jgi:hypothetical protein